MTRKQTKALRRIIISAILFIALVILDHFGIFEKIPGPIPVKFILYVIDYLIIGGDILKKAGKGIWNRQVFDENFLMAFATIGAFALTIYTAGGNLYKIGDCNEAIAVMLFYQIGEFFQSYAVGKSRKNITELMDIRPDMENFKLSTVAETLGVQVDGDSLHNALYDIELTKAVFDIVAKRV